MNWETILLAVIGSGAISAIIAEISNRSKNRKEAERIGAEAEKIDTESEGLLTDHYDSYAERLENRLVKLEGRLDRLERRDMIFESAVSCAYRCEVPSKECPVLDYLANTKIPSKLD